MASSSKVSKALVFAATGAVGAVVLFFALAWVAPQR